MAGRSRGFGTRSSEASLPIRRAGALALGLTLFAATATAVSPAPLEPVAQREFLPLTPPSDPADTLVTVRSTTRTGPQPPIADFPTGPFEPQLAPRVPDPQPGAIRIRRSLWQHDPEISWYGPGFYGKRTACGQAMTTSMVGVAHRTLPCGTIVVFRWAGRVVRAAVVDRGPYVAGRQWDMTAGLCAALHHCFTGPIEWRFA
jgi:hypothetical protein